VSIADITPDDSLVPIFLDSTPRIPLDDPLALPELTAEEVALQKDRATAKAKLNTALKGALTQAQMDLLFGPNGDPIPPAP